MSGLFPVVPLEKVLQHRSDFIEIDDLEVYKRCRVQLHAQGIVERDVVSGSEVKTKKQQVCRANEFLVAEIDAKLGGFGIVPKNLEGAIVSSHYFLFTIDLSVLDYRFLDFFIRTPTFIEQVQAKGTTNYAAIRPSDVLQYEIPFPPLEEQQRIVVRIEELMRKVEEARKPHREALEEVEKVMTGAELEIWSDESLEKAVCLEDVTTFLSRGRQSAQGDSGHYLIKTQHVQQGKYIRSHIMLAPEVATKVQSDAMVQPGDILIACSAAGCLGRVARFTEADQIASTDTHVAIARANPQVILPDYLYSYLKGAQGQIQLRSRERGDWMREKVGFRLTELNLADLKRVPVPLPSSSEQQRIVAYLDELQAKVDSVHLMQATTSAQLNAMLPSILDKAFKGEL